MESPFTRNANDRGNTPSGFLHNRQRVALFELAHEQMSYKSEHPAIRFLGLFASQKQAKRWIKRIETNLPEEERSTIYCTPVMTPVLMVNSEDRMQDTDYRAAKVEKIIVQRNAWLAMREEEHTARRVRDRTRLDAKNDRLRERAKNEPEEENEDEEKERKAKNEIEDDDEAKRWLQDDAKWNKKYKNPFRNVEGRTQLGSKSTRAKALARKLKNERARRKAQAGEMEELPWPVSLTINEQKVLCVGFIADITPGAMKGTSANEPIAIVFRAFSCDDDAIAWTTGPAVSEKVKDPPIFTVRMYEWIFPTLADRDKIPERYTDKRVQEMVQSRKQNTQDLELYEQWCRENNISMAGKTPKGVSHKIIQSGEVTARDKPLEEEEGKKVVHFTPKQLQQLMKGEEPPLPGGQ